MLAFVIGTGRCGSTLVHEVLARHPGSALCPTWRTSFRRLTSAAAGTMPCCAERPLAIAALARSRTGLS